MDITWQVILIGLVLLGALLLVISYVWIFVIQQSPLRLVIMFLRTLMNRDRLVDENAPIEARTTSFRSDSFEAQSAAVKDAGLSGGRYTERQRPRAVLPAEELQHKPDETTTDSGYPLSPDKEEHNNPRPFLKANYRTHNEDIQEEQGNL